MPATVAHLSSSSSVMPSGYMYEGIDGGIDGIEGIEGMTVGAGSLAPHLATAIQATVMVLF